MLVMKFAQRNFIVMVVSGMPLGSAVGAKSNSEPQIIYIYKYIERHI